MKRRRGPPLTVQQMDKNEHIDRGEEEQGDVYELPLLHQVYFYIVCRVLDFPKWHSN